MWGQLPQNGLLSVPALILQLAGRSSTIPNVKWQALAQQAGAGNNYGLGQRQFQGEDNRLRQFCVGDNALGAVG
jgi:hypothetical protein